MLDKLSTIVHSLIYYNIFRTTSVFIPGNTETIIDFECVPTYSKTLVAQIVNMNENVIIPPTSLKSGMISLAFRLSKTPRRRLIF